MEKRTHLSVAIQTIRAQCIDESRKKAYSTSPVNAESQNDAQSEYTLPTFYSQEEDEYEHYDNPMNNTPTTTASSAVMRRSPLQLDIEPFHEEYHTHQSSPAEEEIGETYATVDS